MKKLIVLNYTNGKVHDYIVSSNKEIDESYVGDLGFSASNCEWMCGEDIKVIFHKEVLK